MIDKVIKEKAISDWYQLLDITRNCDMDNIREVFNKYITNDTKDYIDVNYKSICATFEAQWGKGYDKFGGKAVLIPFVEVYDDNGQYLGVIQI